MRTAPTSVVAALAAALAVTSGCSGSGPAAAGGGPKPSARTSASPAPSEAPSGQRHTTYLVDDCWSAHIRPASLVYACGDAGVQMSAIHWSRWGRHRAVGVAGTVGVKNGCCQAHVLHDVHLLAFAPRPYRNGKAAFACLRVSPALSGGDHAEVLWLSASWLGRVDGASSSKGRCSPRSVVPRTWG